MDLLRWLYQASIPVAGYELHWLELIGVLFGLGSAIGGLRRRVWAWPDRYRRQRVAVLCLHHRDVRPRRWSSPIVWSVRPPDPVHPHQHLRLVALEPGSQTQPARRAPARPSLRAGPATIGERVILGCAHSDAVGPSIVLASRCCGDRGQLARTTVVLLARRRGSSRRGSRVPRQAVRLVDGARTPWQRVRWLGLARDGGQWSTSFERAAARFAVQATSPPPRSPVRFLLRQSSSRSAPGARRTGAGEPIQPDGPEPAAPAMRGAACRSRFANLHAEVSMWRLVISSAWLDPGPRDQSSTYCAGRPSHRAMFQRSTSLVPS